MRILFISHDDGKYGAALSLKMLFTILKDKYGVEPIIITRKKNELNQYCDEIGVLNYTLDYAGCITYLSEGKLKDFYNSAKQIIKNNIGHIIAEHELKKKLDLSTIDLIYTNVSTIDFGAWLAKKYEIPHVWHIREFMEEDIKGRPASKSYYTLMNQSAAIIAISKIIAKKWESKGVNPQIMHVIYNGINDIPGYVAKNKFYSSGELKTVFMGSAAPHKGIDHLIDAIDMVRKQYKIKLDVYGNYENEYGRLVQQKVAEKRLDSIISFKGFSKNVRDTLVNYDIGFVCSRSEGFGRVTIEFMLNELAVIASDTGANSELIESGKNGIIYSFNNAEDLAKKTMELINNVNLLKNISQNGRIVALNSYSADKNAETIYNVLLSIMKKESVLI